MAKPLLKIYCLDYYAKQVWTRAEIVNETYFCEAVLNTHQQECSGFKQARQCVHIISSDINIVLTLICFSTRHLHKSQHTHTMHTIVLFWLPQSRVVTCGEMNSWYSQASNSRSWRWWWWWWSTHWHGSATVFWGRQHKSMHVIIQPFNALWQWLNHTLDTNLLTVLVH